ncbi:unannotated protein [freshwater metagenome]|uniref:Unannotated protein n=1 Tax=freshwater metagenome TaxID=449393 RepID=A0A6J7AFL6_9ZZZZ
MFRTLAPPLTLIFFITASIYLVRSQSNTAADFPIGTSGSERVVDIASGATGSQIARVLFEAKIVESTAAFFRIAVSDKRSAVIAPGNHRISTHLSSKEALDQLLDPTRMPNLLKVNEGAWSSEIYSSMKAKGFSLAEIYKATSQIIPPTGTAGIEGLLFPAQYNLLKGETALAVLQRMVDRFSVEAKASGILGSSANFSPMQLLTIASLIQAEGDTVDFAKISAVIRNRLHSGMPLQFDTTVHFIKKVRGHVFLSSASTKIVSPYNTYIHYGLPPGPIGNPGRAAMDAALHPADGKWIFFITVKPGDTRFTVSNLEFLRWKKEYEINLKAGRFGNTQ